MNQAPPTSMPRRFWAFTLTLVLTAASVASYDVPISQSIVHWDWPSDLRKLVTLSEVFSHGIGVAMILIVLMVTLPQRRAQMWRLATCPILAGLASNIAKLTIARYRPQHFYQLAQQHSPPSPLEVETTFQGWFPVLNSEQLGEHLVQSFPSAHTTTAFAFAVGLSWAFPRGRFLFFLFACLAGLQRIDSQSHWPSDVAFGAALGTLVGAFVCYSRPANWLFAELERRSASTRNHLLVDATDQ